jgi:hypothetical protein
VAIWARLQRLFGGSRSGRDDEAALRDEYGAPDPGESDLKRTEAYPSFAGGEAAELVEEDLDEFKPPRDPAP